MMESQQNTQETNKKDNHLKLIITFITLILVIIIGFFLFLSYSYKKNAENDAKKLNMVARDLYRFATSDLGYAILTEDIQTGYGPYGNDELNLTSYVYDESYYWTLVTKDNKPVYILVSKKELTKEDTQIPTFEEQKELLSSIFTHNSAVGCYSPSTNDYLPPYQHGQQIE